MKKLGLYFLAIATISSFSQKSYSMWYLGSEITYTNVGTDSFIVSLNIYRDCNAITLGNQSIKAKCKTNNQLIASLLLTNPSITDVTPTCQTSCTRCQGHTCSFPYGIEKYHYEGLLRLSNLISCCEIKLEYSDCCRNSQITTGPQATNFYLEAILNRCLAPDNSSPEFKYPPLYIACINQDVTFNNGAVDMDIDSNGGLTDSIVTEVISAKVTSGTNIQYTSPYSYDKPVYFWGFPNVNLPWPRGFHVSQSTGDIRFRPMKVEGTVFTIRVSEYRHGQKIGEVMRECQLKVISCPNNQPPIISGPFYKEVCEGNPVTFNIQTMDYDPNDSLTLTCKKNLSGSTWSTTFAKHPTGTFTWTPPIGSASNQPYRFHANVIDDECPVNGSSTREYQILVKKAPQIDIQQPSYLSCGKFQFMLADSSKADWSFGNTLYSNKSKVIHQFTDTGYFHYSVSKNNGVCSGNHTDSVYVPEFIRVDLPKDTLICKGSKIKLLANSSSSYPITKIKWSTGDSNMTMLAITSVPKDTLIKVSVYNDSGCVAMDSIQIEVDNFRVRPFQLAPVCHGNEAIVYTNPVFDRGTKIDSLKWIGLNCGCVKGTQEIFKTYFAAPFAVVAYNENGCMATDTITTVVHPLPNIISSLPKQLCNHDQIIHLDSFIEPLGGLWTLQGQAGLLKSKLDLSILDSGSYVLFYEITDSNNCFNEMQIGFKINELPEVSTKSFDSICSKTGDYILYGLPTGGIWTGSIVSHSGSQFYVSTDIIPVSGSQNYPLIYEFTDSVGCSNQDTMNLTITETKDISFPTIEGCEGDTVELLATPLGGSWSGFGVSGNKLYTSQTGIGDQKVYYSYDNLGCIAFDSVFINIIPYPDDTLVLSKNILSVMQGYANYQWYNNDTLLLGEDKYFIMLTTSGNYHCIITNKYGCTTRTQKIAFSSISEFLQKDFSVYPNPVINGFLTIDVSKLNLSNFNLLILDELGKQIYFEEISNCPGKINRKIEFPAAGSYTVLVVSGGERYFKRIIVK